MKWREELGRLDPDRRRPRRLTSAGAGLFQRGVRRLRTALASRRARVAVAIGAAVVVLVGAGFLAVPAAGGLLPDRPRDAAELRPIAAGDGAPAGAPPAAAGDSSQGNRDLRAAGDPGRTGSGAGESNEGASDSTGNGSTSSGRAPVSLGYYPGWAGYSPDEVDYSPWTRIAHFGIYPRTDGTLRFGDLSRDDLTPAVRAAHANNTEIVLNIGSEGQREQFLGATRDSHRAGFVREIVELASEHGYDGINISWSDQVDRPQFTALLQDLRTEVDANAPGLLVSFAAVSGLLDPALAGDVHHLADYVDIMSYQNDGTAQLRRYLDAGVPAGKLLVGIGLSLDNYHDTTPQRVQGKIDLAQDRGAAGVSVWSFQHLDGGWSDPRLEPLRDYTGDD